MERLTEKHIVDNIDCGYKVKKDTCEDGIIQGWNKTDAINKLGQLEDIEEELGIGLITLAQILKNGVYVKEHIDFELEDSFDYSYFPPNLIRVDFKEKKLLLYFEDIYEICYKLDFNRYGTQFTLTKEELEEK